MPRKPPPKKEPPRLSLMKGVLLVLTVIAVYETYRTVLPQLEQTSASVEQRDLQQGTNDSATEDASAVTSDGDVATVNGIIRNILDLEEPLSPFCEALHTAVRTDPGNKRSMVHAFVCNSGHLPLLMNSLTSIQKISSSWRSIVFGLDKDVCPQLEKKHPDLHARAVCVPCADRVLGQMETDEPESWAEHLRYKNKSESLDASAHWGSAMHKILINSKLCALRDVLHCNLDTFITDADIVFMNDPWPYLTNSTTDIIAQCDTNPKNNLLDMNSGFMYWRDTLVNRNLSQALVKEMTWWAIDQSRVNNLLFERKIPITLLEKEKFPNGFVPNHNLFQWHIRPVNATSDRQPNSEATMLTTPNLNNAGHNARSNEHEASAMYEKEM